MTTIPQPGLLIKLTSFIDPSKRCIHGVAGATRDPRYCRKCLEAKKAADQKKAIEHEQAEVIRHQRAAELALEVERRRRDDDERKQKEAEEFSKNIRVKDYLHQMNPFQFEVLCLQILSRLGYEVRGTPASGDNGIDGILKKNGMTTILQVKRVKNGVGAPVLRDLWGTVKHCNADHALLITLGGITKQASRWIKNKSIEIWVADDLIERIKMAFPDGELIPNEFISKVRSGSQSQTSRSLKMGNCPLCKAALKPRKGRFGSFRGCSRYPQCRFTVPDG